MKPDRIAEEKTRGLGYRGETWTRLVADARDFARNGGRILDVGAGSCRFRAVFEDLPARYWSFDLGTEVWRGDWSVIASQEAMPFRSGRFRLVILYGMLSYTLRPVDLLKDVARLLEPGGGVMLQCPIFYPDYAPDVSTFLTREGLQRAAVEAGLEPVWIEGANGIATTIHEFIRCARGVYPAVLRGAILGLNRRLKSWAERIDRRDPGRRHALINLGILRKQG